MNTIRENIRKQIARLSADSKAIRQEIRTLQWKPGSESEIEKIRSDRTKGKRHLKQFRRPETGQERYNLWDVKRSLKDEARSYILAQALLNGKTYAQAEPVTGEYGPPLSLTSGNLAEAGAQAILADGHTLSQVVIDWVDGKLLTFPRRPKETAHAAE